MTRKKYSKVLVALLKGIIYRQNQDIWNELLESETDIRNFFYDIYLQLVIDESEGFAYLKQQQNEDEDENWPKIIEKRQLSAHVSLLCLILRRDIIENEKEGTSLQAYKTRQEIIQDLKPFYPFTTDEGKQVQKITQAIQSVEKLGFLRVLEREENTFEIMRVIKAFIPAETIAAKLEEIKSYLNKNKNEHVGE